jgi:DNA-binding Lrp family transcriptional regulator
MLSDIDKSIVRQLQGDIPIVEDPFKVLSAELNISEEEYLEITKNLLNNCIIRRFGVVLNHQKVGFSFNPMCVWIIPEDKIQELGLLMASVKEVSHCYHRPTFEGWNYNVFTMIHGKSQEECEEIVSRLSDLTGINDFKLIYSMKELKKSSMKYF